MAGFRRSKTLDRTQARLTPKHTFPTPSAKARLSSLCCMAVRRVRRATTGTRDGHARPTSTGSRCSFRSSKGRTIQTYASTGSRVLTLVATAERRCRSGKWLRKCIHATSPIPRECMSLDSRRAEQWQLSCSQPIPMSLPAEGSSPGYRSVRRNRSLKRSTGCAGTVVRLRTNLPKLSGPLRSIPDRGRRSRSGTAAVTGLLTRATRRISSTSGGRCTAR